MHKKSGEASAAAESFFTASPGPPFRSLNRQPKCTTHYVGEGSQKARIPAGSRFERLAPRGANAKLKQMKKQSGQRIFVLSPAYAGGRRAQMLLSERAQFELAKKLRSDTGATIAEVFTFLSGLYFRGKIAYANTFARIGNGSCGVMTNTPTRGLVDARSNHARRRPRIRRRGD